MLGRKILKRITRLGMAFYAMLWCMSFTVCAYEDPIADLALDGREALLSQEQSKSDTAVLDETTLEDSDLAEPAEGEEEVSQENGQSDAKDAVSTEAIDEEASDEEASDEETFEDDASESEIVEDAEETVDIEDIEEQDADVIADDSQELLSEDGEATGEDTQDPEPEDKIEIGDYPDGYFIVNDTSVKYDVSLEGTGVFESINQTNAKYAVLSYPYNDDSINYGASVKYDATENKNYLVFNDLWPYTPHQDALLIKANYTFTNATGSYTQTATMDVGITTVVKSFKLSMEGHTGTDVESIHEGYPAIDFGEMEGDGNYTLSLIDMEQSSGALDNNRFTWQIFNFTENGLGDIKDKSVQILPYDDNTQAILNFAEYEHDMRLCVVVNYNNYVELPTYGFIYLPDVGAVAFIDAKAAVPELEAHLPETSIKAQIYKAKNPVPVTIRTANFSESYKVDYRIKSASFVNHEYLKYFNTDILDDGRTVTIKASSYVLNEMNKTELASLVKKKLSTQLYIVAEVNGIEKSYTTSENLTISMSAALPTAKDIKVVNTVEFNSYYALEETRELKFEGVDPNGIYLSSDGSLYELGMHQAGIYHLQLHPSNITSKKGTIKLRFYIYDSVNWNLPGGFYLDLPVKYVIKYEPPVLKLNQTSVTLNSKFNQSANVTFSLTGNIEPEYAANSKTEIIYKYYDSKNKQIDETDFPFTVERAYSNYIFDGSVVIKCNENTKPGVTYKLELTPFHTGCYGRPKTITIKTVAAKNEDKVSISVKGKGSIDAAVPYMYSRLNLALTAKNANLYQNFKAFSASLKNGTDVTDYFYVGSYDGYSKSLQVYAAYNGEKAFPLLDGDIKLAGQQVNFKFSFDLAGSDNPADYVNATYSTKIANKKVTPKLKTASIAINPQYYNSSNDIYIPFNSENSWYYDYNIVSDLGENSPFEADVFSEYDIFLKLSPKTGDLTSYAGKTITYKVTPVVPGGNVGTATFKVVIQNPAKVKISVSAKASGYIDAICDRTYTSINVAFKNVYMTNSTSMEYECIDISTKQGKSVINATEWFSTWSGGYSRGSYSPIVIFRRSGVDIPAGTYKAVIRSYYYDSAAGTSDIRASYVDTTVNFKVKRSKVKFSVTPSTVTLINRDYARSASVTISPKTPGMNAIKDIRITGRYEGNLSLTRVGDTDTYRLEFSNNYFEGSWVKKTWMAITKNVTRTIPAEVYFDGSTVPEKINLKVKIIP